MKLNGFSKIVPDWGKWAILDPKLECILKAQDAH